MSTSVTIRPDTKGSIALGKLARGACRFHATTKKSESDSSIFVFHLFVKKFFRPRTPQPATCNIQSPSAHVQLEHPFNDHPLSPPVKILFEQKVTKEMKGLAR